MRQAENALLHPLKLEETSIGKGRAAEHPNASIDLLEVLSKDSDDLVRGAVARNLKTPLHILIQLAQDQEELVRVSVASNRRAPWSLLAHLSNDKSAYVRQKVAQNINAPPEVLLQLGKDRDENVRREVAKHKRAPAALLKYLSDNDESDTVREHAIENENYPEEDEKRPWIDAWSRSASLRKAAGVIEELKKKHPQLADKIDFFIQRDPTKKYLHYEVKTLASGQALEKEIADVIELFHKFKEKLDKKDINQWNFTELRDRLFEIRDFNGDPSKRQKKKELKEEIKKIETSGAEKLYEDDQLELLYVSNKASACFYGKGTKWCITMENEKYFEEYQSQNAVFYYILRKDRNEFKSKVDPLYDKDDPYFKIAISVQRAIDNKILKNTEAIQYWLANDELIPYLASALPDIKNPERILNLIKQDAPNRPMGFLAKMQFKPEELSLDDYIKNLDENNAEMVATKTTNPKVLSYLAKSKNEGVILKVSENRNTPTAALDHIARTSSYAEARNNVAKHRNVHSDTLAYLTHDEHGIVQVNVAMNERTPIESLEVLSKEKIDSVRSAVAQNLNCSTEILSALSHDLSNKVRQAVALNEKTDPETLAQLVKDKDYYVVLSIAQNEKTPGEVLKELIYDTQYGSTGGKKIKQLVARNPNAPIKVLETLAQDGDDGVRGAVLYNDRFPIELKKKYFPNYKYFNNV